MYYEDNQAPLMLSNLPPLDVVDVRYIKKDYS